MEVTPGRNVLDLLFLESDFEIACVVTHARQHRESHIPVDSLRLRAVFGFQLSLTTQPAVQLPSGEWIGSQCSEAPRKVASEC